MTTQTTETAPAAPPRAGFFARHPHIARSVWRRAYLAVNPLVFPTVHVNEFPKSGGTWLCRMLRDCLGWRFDDNTWPVPGRAVVKHHRIGLVNPAMVFLVRDPRDTAVSYYHHCRARFDGDGGFNCGAVGITNRFVFEGETDPAARIRRFVEVAETAPVSPPYTWRAFYQAALDRGATVFRYEDLRADPAPVLGEILTALGTTVDPAHVAAVADNHNIERIIARREAEGTAKGHHFIRRGKVGGYADELEPASIALIEENNAALMRRFGYA